MTSSTAGDTSQQTLFIRRLLATPDCRSGRTDGLCGGRVTSREGVEWSDPVAGLEGEHIDNIFILHDGDPSRGPWRGP